jgi:hypothetical protein
MTHAGKLDVARLVAIDTHVHLESEAAGGTAADAAATKYFGADGVARDPDRRLLSRATWRAWSSRLTSG